MKLEEYTLVLGQIIVNLQSLECVLRVFPRNHDVSVGSSKQQAGLAPLKVGQSVAVDAFTNYDTLGQLIDTFNGIVTPVDATLRLDKNVVNLRDALAHGRVWAEIPRPPMQLVKFSKPDKVSGTVTVTYADLIDEQWLVSARGKASAAIMNVAKAGQILQTPEWWTTT